MKTLAFFLLFVLTGCGMVTSTVKTPTGDVYEVTSKSDALVEYNKGDTKFIVDNRGRPGLFERTLELMLLRSNVDVNVGDDKDK